MIKEVNLKTWCTAGANPWNVSKLQLILENIWRDKTEVLPLTIALKTERYYIENILYINSKNQTCIWVVRKRLGGPLVPPFHHSLWAMRDAAACKAAYCLVSGVYTLYTPLSLSKSRLTADHYSCRGPSHQPDSTYHKLGSAPCLGLALVAPARQSPGHRHNVNISNLFSFILVLFPFLCRNLHLKDSKETK